MADSKVLTDEENDDIEVVEVEQLPKPGETPPEAQTEDDEEHEEEDARLADTEDDEDETSVDPKDKEANKKRANRRKIQKQARDRTLAELDRLRQFERDTIARFASLENTQLTQSEAQIDSRLADVRNDIATAERIHAAAVTAGNGDDAMAALRLRDTARDQEAELLRAKTGVTETRTKAPDQQVVALSNEWKGANASWYGVDQNATSVANQIDSQVARDGYNPATPAYWQELSRRLQARFQPEDKGANRETTPKKKPPPQGASREHAPESTRKGEVYVTPERKQALMDLGVWDDPAQRNRYLKAYSKYDREQAERA